MNLQIYRIIHLFGLSLVLLSLGGIMVHAMNGGTKASNSFRKGAVITHGVGLLLVLVAGFGMLHKTAHDTGWMVGKMAIWLVLGGAVAFAYKSREAAKILFFVVPILVLIGSVMALYPFPVTPPVQ
jgi:hypothetical protein